MLRKIRFAPQFLARWHDPIPESVPHIVLGHPDDVCPMSRFAWRMSPLDSALSVAAFARRSARPALQVQFPDRTNTVSLPASRAPAWLAVARSNPRAAKALRLFGTGGESWVDLYRILEVITDDVGADTSLVERGWATRKMILTNEGGPDSFVN